MTGRYFPLIGATHSPPMKSSRAGISTSSPIVTLKTHTHTNNETATAQLKLVTNQRKNKANNQNSSNKNRITKTRNHHSPNSSNSETKTEAKTNCARKRQENIYKECYAPRTWMKKGFSLHSASTTSLNRHNFHPCELTWTDPSTRQYSVPPKESMWTSSIGS
jgi:hypothetical protein